MIRAFFFLGVGLIAGGFIGGYIGEPGAGAWGIGFGIPVASMALVFWLVSRTLRGIPSDNPVMAKMAVQAGRVGMARVEHVGETGTRVNERPLCDIELTVQPRHGQTFRTKFRRVLNFQTSVAVIPGSVHPVAILIEGGAGCQLHQTRGTERPELAEAADSFCCFRRRSAQSKIGETATQRDADQAIDRNQQAMVPARAVLYLVMICVGAVIVLLPMRGAVELSVESKELTGSWIPDMRTEPGVSAALNALELKVGHDRVSRVSLYKDFVLIDAPVGPGTLNTDSWQFRGGKLISGGPASTQPESEEELFRIRDVHWQAYWPAVQSVSSGLDKTITDDIGIFSERETNSDLGGDSFMQHTGDVIARFTVNEPYSSIAYTMNGQGENISDD
ncbi:hypothetical protein AAHB37_17135 [Glutamicibacter halophytocola]|uniref:hypothetical protein n=1 Tax=Glutamicibacter halophytocola TaxID=1933880 RepID=UPI00321B2085